MSTLVLTIQVPDGKHPAEFLRQVAATWDNAKTPGGLEKKKEKPVAVAEPEGDDWDSDEPEAAEEKPKRGRGRPKKTAEPETDFDDEADFSDDEETSDIDISAMKKKSEAKTKAPTLDDVVGALQRYAAKNGREKAHKILEKLGVKSPRQLDESDYGQVLKMLKI